MGKLSMTRAERDAFLADTHVAVLAIADGERGPFLAPIWYWYEPGGAIHIVTGGDSRKIAMIESSGRASLCAQTESMPYKYVWIEGPIEIVGPPDFERDVRAVAIRYLGEQMGEAYLAATTEMHETAVLLRLHPERWNTADFARFS
jgi:nitroimidazol reductase NimA-like FMN-containing flavoprotein (pyridoxamine 5'-phosphate oxidase superfamily)